MQVHGSLTMHTAGDCTGGALDMMAVLSMLHKCSKQAPSHSADCNIDALSQCDPPPFPTCALHASM